jgi:hypothetical protein
MLDIKLGAKHFACIIKVFGVSHFVS